MKLRRSLFLAHLVFIILIFSSCKKTKEVVTPPVTPPVVISPEDKLKDSVLLYTRDIYWWYKQIPSSFNPRTYTGPDKIMEAIRQFSMEPGFPNPVDRWSFAMKQAEWDQVSSGISADFGLGVFFLAEGDLRVKSVENESPAGLAGIHRGWKISKINGNSNITTANADFIVNNVYSGTTTSFTFQKPDGTAIDITLNSATYSEHPVYLDSVYSINSKKIGYMVLNSFLGDTLQIYNDFQRVFNGFQTQGVTDIVIDLRYNGGGYVSVQQKLANYLAPSVANGGLMMKQEFNDKYAAQFNQSTFFNKTGPLNPDHIFFIVTSGTASASELLINNLKPYMNVKLVGPVPTHGKPVGFFPIPVGDWYIFPVSFRTTNKNGQGNYFNGIALDNVVGDGLDKDWGDVRESSLASVIKYVTTGMFSPLRNGPGNIYSTESTLGRANNILDKITFKGSIGDKKIFK